MRIALLFSLVLIGSLAFSQTLQWANYFSERHATGNQIALNDNGNSYVLAKDGCLNEIFKYDANGNRSLFWMNDSTELTDFCGIKMLRDQPGNFYVLGNLNSYDYLKIKGCLIKLDSNGIKQWMLIIDPDSLHGDRVTDIALSADQTIVCAGIMQYFQDTADVSFLSRVNENGNFIWQHFYSNIDASNIACYSSNDILIGGSRLGDFFEPIPAILKVNGASGDKLWNTIIEGGGVFQADKVFIYHDSDVYLSGTTTPLGVAGIGKLLLKFDQGGLNLWMTGLNNLSPYSSDLTTPFCVDDRGNIYATDQDITTSKEGDSVFTYPRITKFNSRSGAELWSYTYQAETGPLVLYNSLQDIEYKNGFVYAAGDYGAGGNKSLLVLKLDTAGSLIWKSLYQAENCNGVNEANDLAIDSSGNIFVTGSGCNNVLTLKYASITGIQNITHQDLQLLVFPTIVTSTMMVSVSTKKDVFGKLSIEDINGNVILTFMNGKLHSGNQVFSHDCSSFAPGIYLLRLQTSEGLSIKKFVKQ